ncbi:MAG TPA: type I-E CRISPR-associated endoribonuclease Cas2e [Rubrivivax sp.]|nr:type I-E CRISPR-associated endoribonuclease Cas2e [Rubrivivax sp.]
MGSYGRRVREHIWTHVEEGIEGGNAVMLWQSKTEAGYEFRTLGARRLAAPCTRVPRVRGDEPRSGMCTCAVT